MDKEILNKFKALGPYKNAVVRNPWEEGVIDVEEIQHVPYAKVINLIDGVKESGKAAAIILQGEPGSGKSHLLWRISKNAEEKRFLFVNIIPYISVSGISYVSILQSLMESLLKKHPNLKSRPMDHLIGWTIKRGLFLTDKKHIDSRAKFYVDTILNQRGLPYVSKTTFETIPKSIREKLKQQIKTNLMDYYKNFPRYFFHILIMLTEKDKERLAIDFLKGEELTKDDLKTLKLSQNFRLDEYTAYRLLVSIINFSPFPLVISIDQIETIDAHLDKGDIVQFFEKIVRLFSNTGNVLFLLSVQTQTFKKWEKFLPESVLARLTEKTTILPITLENAKEIVKKRNAFYFGKLKVKQKDPFFPFKEKDVEEVFKQGNRNPRRLIKAMNYLLEHGKTGMEEETVQSMINGYIKKSDMNEFNKEITDLIIKTSNNYKLLRKTATYSIVQIDKSVFTANDSRYSLFSSINNMAKIISSKKAAKGIIIRSKARFIKKSAIKTNMLIERYGIKTIYLDNRDAKTLIALSKMLRDAESQDIDISVEKVKKYAKEIIKKTINVKNGEKVKTAELSKKFTSAQKVEDILTQYKVITYSKLRKISNVREGELDEILRKLKEKGKIRTMAKGQMEKWIFNNEI